MPKLGENHPGKIRMREMQRRFVDVMFSNGFRAKAAAIEVGIKETSAHTTSSRWMQDPVVIEMIEQRRALNKAQDEGCEERWVREVKAIAYSDIRTLFEHREVETDDEEGEEDEEGIKPKKKRSIIALKDITELPREIAAAIASIKTRKISAARSESGHPEILTEVKLWSKPDALKMHAEYLGLIKKDDGGQDGMTVNVVNQINQVFGDGRAAETGIETLGIPGDDE